MKVPEAGWLSIQHNRGQYFFIPLKGHQTSELKSPLPAIVGAKTPGQLIIRNWSSKQHLPVFTPARVKKTSDHRYQVGPFVAILAADGKQPFYGNQNNFADIIRTGRTMGVSVYVMTPAGFRHNQQNPHTVRGFLLDHRSRNLRWIPAELPMPNVVYNRIPTRTEEQKPEVQQVVKQLMNTPGIHFFNPGFFDKWSLYRLLSASPRLRQFLPETAMLENPAGLKQMLERYPSIYLKPANGKAGIKMMRVNKKPDGFELHYQSVSAKKRLSIASLPALWNHVQQLKKPGNYILQQGIPLAQYHGRPFDVRMLLQKDGQGNWGLSGAGIRVAGATAISTHVPMGGKIESLDQVFQAAFGDRKKEMREKIENIGLELASFIETKQAGPLGEMSIDLGIEPNGRMWFFEANSKPMKFDEPDIRIRSLRRIIQYSLYLSEFSQAVKGGR
ncbi:YheC/YheD family protein [Thermoactinomyces sp. CICC 10522]|uniref:YheC/YheD family endospore coat-associated protein n=1 Tax=Thermoactinomyces sp. CICC 10522 TaxID=2767427 RepID=UPI0018DB98E9|nr:YheC/YheD family protein [Thermoactinomyces sp. CICC 10522]